MHRYNPPMHIRIYEDIAWRYRHLRRITPDILAALATAALIILLPIMAAFVV